METPKIEGGNVPAEVKVEVVEPVIVGGATETPVIAGGDSVVVEGGVTTRRGTRTSPRRSRSKSRSKRRSHSRKHHKKHKKHSYPRHKKHSGGVCPPGKVETIKGNCVKRTSTALPKSRRACKSRSKTRNSKGRCVGPKRSRTPYGRVRKMFRGGEVDKVVVEPVAQ